MPSRKTKPKKASPRRRRLRRTERDVVIEETTRVVPARRRVVAVRQEPVDARKSFGRSCSCGISTARAASDTSKTVVRRKRV